MPAESHAAEDARRQAESASVELSAGLSCTTERPCLAHFSFDEVCKALCGVARQLPGLDRWRWNGGRVLSYEHAPQQGFRDRDLVLCFCLA